MINKVIYVTCLLKLHTTEHAGTAVGISTLCPNKKHVTAFYTITLTISVRLQ